MVKVKNAGHLGGYLIGGDVDTWYPDLWRWCVTQGVRSVLDVGCGEGETERVFRDAGAEWTGIEGVPQPPGRNIIRHDFTKGPLPLGIQFHLGWCCEVVEHIEERYLRNVMDVFCQCRVVLMTHAWPGQGGYHHVNERNSDYWIGAFAAAGFELDWQLTERTRALAGLNDRPANYYRRGGLAFRNSERHQGGLLCRTMT